ncbi:MAG: hypothetical protein HY318_07245, partial [Armatimonadetes bacterium]|nr:hypothetical protein [Armatimonadota bacterium]
MTEISRREFLEAASAGVTFCTWSSVFDEAARGNTMAKSNLRSREPIRSGLETVRDRLWIWAHDAFFYDGAYGLPGKSRMTPVEGAFYMGIPNLIFIRLSGKPTPPFHQYYIPFRPLKRVEWSLFDNNGQPHELGEEQDHIYRLAAEEPNLVGVVMDDFIVLPGSQSDGHWLAENNVSFPVALTLSLPNPTRIEAVELTQAEWPSGDYRSWRFAIDVSSEGENWQEVFTGEVPNEGGAILTVPLHGRESKSLRVRIL